jgi:hypothetical protein
MKIELDQESMKRIVKDDLSKRFDVDKASIDVSFAKNKATASIDFDYKKDEPKIGFQSK